MTDRLQRILLAVVSVGVAAGLLAYLSFAQMDDDLVYYWTPSQLAEKGDAAQGVTVRIMGLVEPGSVEWTPEDQRLAFRMSDGTTTVAVIGTGAPPQMFREGIGVVVEGELHADGVFRSDTVIVKHDNGYQAPAEGELPDDVYRTLAVEGT